MNKSKENLSCGNRLHKFSPLFILIHVIWKSIVPLALGLYTYSKVNSANHIIIAFAVVISAFSLLQYWFYHYWLETDKIEIKEGVFFKQHRKVPYTRIQNVNVVQNPLQRILKVSTLQLESASGGKPEAVMRVVGLDVVEELKRRVKTANSNSGGVIDETQNEEAEDKQTSQADYLLKVSTKDVIKFGIISQKGMVYGALIFGFLAQNQIFMMKLMTYLDLFFTIPDFTKITFAEGVIYVSVIGLVMFVFLQLMSVLWALMKFYQFQIEKQTDRLQANMGLLSKVSATIPLKKIQLYRISENPLHKFFNARTITIETAGGVNTDKSGIVMRWLAPIIKKVDVASFIRKVEPKIKIGLVDWQSLPHRAWKRVFKKGIYLSVLILVVLLTLDNLPYFSIRNYIWFVFPLTLPLAFVYAKNFVKKTGYYFDGDIICFKSGVWFGKQSFVKIKKIQTIMIHESPFDRRNKMATLEIDTAGSNLLLHHVKIPYLELHDAYQIRNFINNKLQSEDFDW
ncbi:MAG: PH domain-containing protein [Gammaproteobacteria bacterium]|jgi:putative membrane protein